VGQPAGEDHRSDGVADRHDSQRQDGAEVAGADLEAHQGADTGEPDEQPERAPCVEHLVDTSQPGAARPGEQEADQRHRGDEKAGQRAGQLLGDTEQQPGQRDLDRGEGEDRPP